MTTIGGDDVVFKISHGGVLFVHDGPRDGRLALVNGTGKDVAECGVWRMDRKEWLNFAHRLIEWDLKEQFDD